MRTLFFVTVSILILTTSQIFSAYQMRGLNNFDHSKMSEITQKINNTGQLNQYERRL